MVSILNYEQRTNAQGEKFIALILQGDIEMVQSKASGRMYATAFKVSIPSTFTESTAKKFVGRDLTGVINKVECEPYSYTTKDGEVLTLNHTYVYCPNPSNLAEVIGANPAM